MVAFELEVVSTKIDRFGWGQMSEAMKDRLTLDWMDALDPYGLDEIKTACSVLMGSKPKDATNEHRVKAAIVAGRAKALAALPKPLPLPEPERPEPSAASKERVNAMVEDLSSGLKMSKPPVIYKSLRGAAIGKIT